MNHTLDFNKPVEVTKVFKYRKTEEEQLEEFATKASFCWEDVMFIEEYPYKDDWKQYYGPKYYVSLRSYSECLLVLGEYESMLSYWTEFRTKHPILEHEE